MTEPDPIDWGDVPYDAPAEIEPDETPVAPRTPLEFPAGPGHDDPACKAERDRVLRHPEIAKRLCDPPQRYARPEQWNGWIPPETWREATNDSPFRRQLLEIVKAAVEAEKEAAK